MGIGYTRQSTTEIQDGQTVFAGDLNAEFDLLQDFASGSLGHSHDGTTGKGPKINLTTSITGVLPALNGGVSAKNKIDATTAPNEFNDTSDGYGPGSLWVDTTNKIYYFCVDSTNGAAVWRRFQLNDPELTAIAGLTSAADKGIQFTGSGTAATYDLTTYAKTLLDDVDAASARATLGLTIGTNVQAYDADLTALASLTSAADKGIQFTGSGTAATYDLTTAGKALLDDASASDQLTTLGVSTFMKTVLDDVDAASARATLGVSESGASQPADATLTALAALDSTAGMVVQTGADTFTKRTLAGNTTYISISNGNGVSGNPTVSLSSGAITSLGKADSALQSSDIGVSVQGYDATTVKTTAIQTLTNKTLTSPDINGGNITGITDLAIADGGTGASTASAAFTNLKQAATTSATGVVELATSAETIAASDTARAVTPSGLGDAVFGLNQTWQGVTRTVGTSYQNTTGRPIMCVGRLAIGGTARAQVSPDNSTWVDTMSAGTNEALSFCFVVPNTWYYRTTVGGQISQELR